MNVSGNMIRSKFYVCPVCGNVIHSMGEMVCSILIQIDILMQEINPMMMLSSEERWRQ